MQSHRRKRMSEHQAHSFRHVALSGIGLLSVITEVGTLKHAPNDLAQDQGAQNGSACAPANEEAFDIWLAASFHPPGERGGVGRWQHPRLFLISCWHAGPTIGGPR